MTYDSAITEALQLAHKHGQQVYILGYRDHTDEYEFRTAYGWERDAFYMSEDVFAIANPDGSFADVETVEY